MFLLDTNVVSELRKRHRADRNVAAWVLSVPHTELHVSAITIFELELGVILLERRDAKGAVPLRLWLDNRMLPNFSGRIIPVDISVARRAAALHVPKKRPERDAFIAATAIVHGLTVVTRNLADFEPTGVAIFNPWEPKPIRT